MRPSHTASPLARALAKALPFERAWPRYALCAWLLAGAAAAAWAYLVAKPATETTIARAGHLIDLERSHAIARLGDAAAVESLREQAHQARRQIHRNAQALDLAIVATVDRAQALGWSAVLANVERDEASNPRLSRATYQIELRKPALPAAAPSLNAEIVGILQAIDEREAKIEVLRLEIQADDGRSGKAFLTLAAAIAK